MKQVLFPSVLGFLVLAAAAPPVLAVPATAAPAIVDRDGSLRSAPQTSAAQTPAANDANTGDPVESNKAPLRGDRPPVALADNRAIAQNDNPVAQDNTPSAPASADPVTGALNFNPPGAPVVALATPPSATADSIINPPAAPPAPPPPSSPPPSPSAAPSASSPPTSSPSASSTNKDHFAGGSDSLVARVVGAAEGTRNPDGTPTSLYEGHKDPGNGVWNRGTFSYQFGNEENLSADEADKRQIAKIKRIYESVMKPQAQQHGLAPLTLAEEVNGIDLINQAPLAVTENGGYIERLAEAKQKKGLSGEQAILEARVWSFWDGQKGGWDAPGLRAYDDMGKEASIRHDQDRRMGMIDKALDLYQQQNGAIAQNPPTPQAQKMAAQSTDPRPQKSANPSQIADLIIFNRS